jgi:hypothetical protein
MGEMRVSRKEGEIWIGEDTKIFSLLILFSHFPLIPNFANSLFSTPYSLIP